MTIKPQVAILWLALAAWCSVLAGATVVPVALDELEAAETRRPQGWFKGIGFGGFRFGGEEGEGEEADQSEESEVGEGQKTGAVQFSNTEEVQAQAPKKGQKYGGISQQRGGLVSAGEDQGKETQKGEQEGDGGKKQSVHRGHGGERQSQKGQEGDRRQTGERSGAQKDGGLKKQEESNKGNANQEEGSQGGNKQNARGGARGGQGSYKKQAEEAVDLKKEAGDAQEFRDFYFGQRESQKNSFRGHSRSQYESQQGYAIVEESEDKVENTEGSKDKEVIAQENAGDQKKNNDEGKEGNQEGGESYQEYKGFYSGRRDQQQQGGFRGHKRGQQEAGKLAFSAIRQASFFVVPSSQRDQQQRSESNNNNKDGDKKIAEGWSFQYVLPVKH